MTYQRVTYFLIIGFIIVLWAGIPDQFVKKINVLKTFLEIETTHYLEGLDLKLNNETYAKVPNL